MCGWLGGGGGGERRVIHYNSPYYFIKILIKTKYMYRYEVKLNLLKGNKYIPD